MPLYEYQCDAYGRRFEIIQKLSDPSPDVCRHCGKGPVHRLISSPAFQFKGTGWYATDYAQKGKSDSSNTSTSDATKTKSDAGSDSPKTDTGSSETGSAPKTDSAPASAPANTTPDSPKK